MLDTGAAAVDLLARMTDLTFLRPASPASLAALAPAAPLGPGTDPGRLYRSVAALDRAGPDDVTMFRDGDDPADLAATRAGICFVAREHVGKVPSETIAVIADRPEEALRQALELLYPASLPLREPVFERYGVDPTAIVHSDARLEQDVTIDPGAVIGPRVEIGRGTMIGANVVIGPGVRIGRGCIVGAQANLHAALLGDRVTIQGGARIGLVASTSGQDREPGLGRVVVQDDVEIGANAVIERGRLGDTMIGERARIGPLTVIVSDTLVERLEIRANEAIPRRLASDASV